MDKITLSKDDLYELMARKPDFDGSEGNLYKMGKYIYKLYHNPYAYNATRLGQIISFQPRIKRTKLPIGPIYFENQFIGSILYQFEEASSFETIYNADLHERIQKLRELSLSLQELTSNGLVLEDLFYGNLILTKDRTVEIIDTDGNNIRLLQNDEQIGLLLNCFRGLILECCEPEIEILKKFKRRIPYLKSADLSYGTIEQLLNYINSDQSIQLYKKKIS